MSACGGDSGPSSSSETELDAQPADLQPVPEDPGAMLAVPNAEPIAEPGAEPTVESSAEPTVEPSAELAASAEPTAEAPASAEPTAGALAPVEFIPWLDLANAGDGAALPASNAVRSVSLAASYENDDLLIAVADESGDNRVIALNVAERTYRDHWPHFPCGDCKAAAGGATSVIATATAVYGSTDGGYRYFTIAETGFGEDEPADAVQVVADQVWVLYRLSLWFNAPLLTNQAIVQMPWTRSIVSLWQDTGLQVTSTAVRRLAAAAEVPRVETTNPCAAPREYYEFALAYHDAERTLVSCADATVAVTSSFPDEAFTLWPLDAPALWMGSSALATETSWYSTTLADAQIGVQGVLAEGEQVFGYAANERLGFRVTNFGIWVSALSQSS